MSTGAKIVIIFMLVLLSACGAQISNVPTITPLAIPTTWTTSPTLHPDTGTISPTYTITPQLTSKPTFPSDWFPIPKLTNPEPIDFSTAQVFKSINIPPLPDELVIEFNTGMPYGEVPPETIFYQLYLIRKGNARMLWLGIPFKETVGCCGKDTPHRIYDSIPFPPIETDSVLIPFICIQEQEWDMSLIAVAELPENGAPATNILYAWRIDPATTTLQPVSTQGMECGVY